MFGRKKIRELEKEVRFFRDMFQEAVTCLELATDMMRESKSEIYYRKKTDKLRTTFNAMKVAYDAKLKAGG